MASTVPWTVRTTKRKATTNTPNPRKRRRSSLPADDQANSRARLRRQQTLTQIQWAPSRSFSFERSELEPLKFQTEPRGRSRQQVPRLEGRDSTLTQMHFLVGRPSIELDKQEQELTPLPISKEEDVAVPQLDGNRDSPRKPRTSKTLGARAGSHRKRKSLLLSADESQEYLPATKRGKGGAGTDETPDDGQRRRSNRYAIKMPSDPVETFAGFQKALADAVSTAIKPALEVNDSTGLDEGTENVAAPYQNNLFPFAAHPIPETQDLVDYVDEDVDILPVSPTNTVPKMTFKTPRKQRRCIPSSQSPESLPPSTGKRRYTSRSRLETTPKRNPLSELSTNTPSRLPVADVDDFTMGNSTSKRRICTLKLPRIHPSSRKKRVESSQIDIWSVQPISSPKRKVHTQKSSPILRTAPVEAMREGVQAEIPFTSQAENGAAVNPSSPQPADAETQDGIMSLSDVFGVKRKDTANIEESLPTSTESDVAIRDFGIHSQQTPQKETQYVSFLQSQPENTNENDEFGSPVANDTQFAADLARIPTSSMRTSDPLNHLDPYDTVIISSSSASEGNVQTSLLPSPKLVTRIEYQNPTTTTIPTKGFSSPTLPPMPPQTHRPICPASLPHPSQVSTQDPSQQLPQLSSIPQRSPTHTQMITIKDSSSVHEHLSELPEYYDDELQLQRELQGTQCGVLEDDDNDDAYDDLDPRTPRKTVRFQQPPREAKTPRDQPSRSAPSPSRSAAEDNVSDTSPSVSFTQNGHVTAARIEDMRRRGLIPPGYNPPAYKVPSARELLPAWMFDDEEDDDDDDEL